MTHEPPAWISRYQHILHEEGGRSGDRLDCHGLVLRVLAEQAGIILPDHSGLTMGAVAAAAVDLSGGRFTADFTAIEQGFEEALDVAVIRVPMVVDGRGRRGWWHLGVVTRPGHVLHLNEDMGVVEQPYRTTPTASATGPLRAQDVRLFRHRVLMARRSAGVAA